MSSIGIKLSFCRTSVAAFLATGLATSGGVAQAFVVDSDNPDVEMRWDNTVRYNAGWRVRDRNPGISNNAGQDEAEFLFDKGDMFTNRVDLYSEFDYTYQKNMGFRISGAAWYDDAYDDNGKSNPALGANTSYPRNQFTDYVKRYYQGPSGEFLDAFVWKNFSLMGEANNLNVKVGRFATLWGVPTFGTAASNSVSVDMAPGDGQKGSLSPGATAKETALPIAQTIANWQINNSVSVAGQITHEWRSSRVPEGGTYFGVADAILYGPPRTGSPGSTRLNTKKGKAGDLSLMLAWRAPFLTGGSYLNFYWREFSQKSPTWAANSNGAGGIAAYFENDVKLAGMSLDTSIGGVAVGEEVSHRTNQPLSINPAANTAATDFEGPKGETWHALLNFTNVFSKTAFWDTASLLGELTYQRLDEVTDNASMYKSKDYLAAGSAVCSADEIVKGCSTKDAWHVAFLFGPTWQQILPSWDLNGSLLYQTGLKGNAPTGGINEGASLIQIAGEMVYVSRHSFKLAYSQYYGKSKYGFAAASLAGPVQTVNGTLGNYGDRDTLQFTYNYSF